eukprot:scaffold211_cov83-Skeletonema_dohrnii-CCMP3373.AAC.9
MSSPLKIVELWQQITFAMRQSAVVRPLEHRRWLMVYMSLHATFAVPFEFVKLPIASLYFIIGVVKDGKKAL